LTGGAEEFGAARDELGVFGHEDLAGGAQVEVLGLVEEELAVDAGPHQAAVGVDVDFADTEFSCGQVLMLINTLRALFQLSASGIDPFDFVLRN